MTKQEIIEIGKPIVNALDKDSRKLSVYDSEPIDGGIYPRNARSPILYNVFTVKTQHVTGEIEDLQFIFGANNLEESPNWQEQYIESAFGKPDLDYMALSELTYQVACNDTIDFIDRICENEGWHYPKELCDITGRKGWGNIQNYLEDKYKLNGGNYFYYVYMSKWEVRKREYILASKGILQDGLFTATYPTYTP